MQIPIKIFERYGKLSIRDGLNYQSPQLHYKNSSWKWFSTANSSTRKFISDRHQSSIK